MYRFTIVLRLCLCFCLVLSLVGCSIEIDVDHLLKAPKLSQEQEEIYQALTAVTGSSISLKYPKSGNFLSAFIIADIDGDGEDESLVFYQGSTDTDLLRIHVLDCISGKWESICERTLNAEDIEKVEIATLGESERINIIVGYSSSIDTNQYVDIFSYADSDLLMTFTQAYSYFTVGEVGEFMDLLLLSTGDANQAPYAAVYQLDTEGLYHEYKYHFSDGYTEYSQLLYGETEDGDTLLYIDACIGNASVQTEILCKTSDKLDSALAEGEIVQSNRAYGLWSTDIDGDGVPEIPVQSLATEDNALPRTQWLCLVDDCLVTCCDSYYSLGDGYLLCIPEQWESYVSMQYLDSNGSVCFVKNSYDDEGELVDSEVLLQITVTSGDTGVYETEGYVVVRTKGTASYLVKLTGSEHSIPLAEVLVNFRTLNI